MKIEDIEKTLKEIREREDYLVRLKDKGEIEVAYYPRHGLCYVGPGGPSSIYTLNKEETEFLKMVCISEIKRLKKSIECLTE